MVTLTVMVLATMSSITGGLDLNRLQDAKEMLALLPEQNANPNSGAAAATSERPADWVNPDHSFEETIIIVLSARGHFDKRAAIRETWAKEKSNVFFVIGNDCPFPPAQRKNELTCEQRDEDQNNSINDAIYTEQLRVESLKISKEQETFRDLIWTPQPENYRGLPHKLKEAYLWIVNDMPTAKWIVKTDDDMYARVDKIGAYLQTIDASKYVVLGHIRSTSRPQKKGKWAELDYNKTLYPSFPQGSFGHAVSRPVAEYIAGTKDTLFDYQGEDVSIGIWLDESPHKAAVQWLESSQFARTNIPGKKEVRSCYDDDFVIIGHEISPDVMKLCYESDKRALPSEKEAVGTLTAPKVTKDTTVIIVMSARENFFMRAAIRESWASGHDNVYFAINTPCLVPKHMRPGLYKLGCEGPMGDDTHLAKVAEVQEKLFAEQEKYQDIINIERPDSYKSLVHKLKAAFDWVLKNTKADWIVKADDDTFVRVSSVAKLLSRYSPTNPTVVGRVIHGSRVAKQGKWAEPEYHQKTYPPWPQGSCGYAVSRPVAEYVANHIDSLYEYQGEDASLGIWMDESPLKNTVLWEKSAAFANEGNCHDPKFVMVGHQLSPTKMRACYTSGDETTHEV